MLIGLVGQKHSGKDTVYRMIAEDHPGSTKRIAFADKLKISAAALLNIPIDQIDMLKNNPNVRLQMVDSTGYFTGLVDLSIRDYLQRYGTEAHRDVFGSNFWIDEALPETFVSMSQDIHVVTDVRFRNEFDRIKNLGGYIWYINRPELNNSDSHASEKELVSLKNNCDIYMNNEGTLEDLRKSVRLAFNTTARRAQIESAL